MLRSKTLRLLAPVVLFLLLAGASCQNDLQDAWSSNPPAARSNVALPHYSHLQQNEAKAVVYGGKTHLFERWTLGNGDYAVYQSIGSDLAHLPAPTPAVVPSRDDSTPPLDGAGCAAVYAPGAAVVPSEPNRIVVVFEANPGGGTGCGQRTNTNEYLSAMTSSDYGATWSNPHRIVDVSNGFGGNVGTPALIWLPKLGQWALYYHENQGPDTTALRPHLRVYAVGTDVSNLPYEGLGLTCVPGVCSDTVLTVNGAANRGVGRADITYWVTGARGTDDNAYYMVLETFNGTRQCESTASGDYDQLEIAKTDPGAGPQGVYTVQTNKLGLPLNPMCEGPDVPSWYYASGAYHIISNNISSDRINGWNLLAWDLS